MADTDKAKNLGTIGKPDLASTLENMKEQLGLTLNCVQIGEIQSFDATTQLATIKVAMKQVKDLLEDGTRILQEYPLLLECPVFFLFGGNDFISLPITAGDPCIILFNDREIDQWLNHGAGQYPVSIRKHDISDALALVGIRPLTNSVVGYITNGIRLSHGNGNSKIDIKTNLIESVATLLLHHGNAEITGNLKVDGTAEVVGNTKLDADLEVVGNALVDGGLTVLGQVRGNGGTATVDANVLLTSGHTLTAPQVISGNGATGSFNVVTVVNGIVTGGS